MKRILKKTVAFFTVFFFGKMKKFHVVTKNNVYEIGGRRFKLKENGFLTVYDAWRVCVASMVNVESIFITE